MTRVKKHPLFVMKNPLYCKTIVKAFLTVKLPTAKMAIKLFAIDGDLNPISLTLNDEHTLDFFGNIITVQHQVKKDNDLKWQAMGFINCDSKYLSFNMPVTEIEKQHNSILYTFSQIYWTLSHLNNNISEGLLLYQMKTKNCPFCNRRMEAYRINYMHKGCQKCNQLWRIM